VGDVATPQVLALAKKYLEPIPSQPPPPAIRTKEPEQLGERHVTVTKAAQLPIEMVAYHVPETKYPDDAALDLLETLLSSGQSSRLYSRLVDKDQLVLSINSFRSESLDPGLLIFSLQPRSGVTPGRAEKALFEELDRLRDHPVDAQELRKAKNQELAGQYRELKTIAGRANLLGKYELFHGDYRQLFSREQTIEAVTAADIQRVAREYLKATNRTIATLIPDSPAAPSDKGSR
jgi:zinc protease